MTSSYNENFQKCQGLVLACQISFAFGITPSIQKFPDPSPLGSLPQKPWAYNMVNRRFVMKMTSLITRRFDNLKIWSMLCFSKLQITQSVFHSCLKRYFEVMALANLFWFRKK